MLLFLAIFLLQGCLVKSLHPFFTERDIIFKKELLGNWTDKDSAAWEIRQHMRTIGFLKPQVPDKSYDITLTDNKGSSHFVANLFRLQDQLYLDFYPTEISCQNDLAEFNLVATHSLAKVVRSLSAGTTRNGCSACSIKTRSVLPMSGYRMTLTSRILNRCRSY